MRKYALTIALLAACSASHAQVLTVSDTITVMADGTVVPTGADGFIDTSGFSAPNGPLNPTSGEPWQYGIRERFLAQQDSQTNRRAYSFLQFDTSALTSADVQDPNFSATFAVDYVGHLNNANGGFNAELGQVTAGAWDSTTTLPTAAFSTGSTSLGTLVADVDANATPIAGITLDVTSLVVGWVDGSIANQGLTFTSNDLVAQSAYFSNATITAAVPEPSAVALVGLAICGLAFQRKRRQ